MPDDVLTKDFTTHLERLASLKAWLQTLYYHAEFGKFYTRPVISLLVTAADFLIENLTTMRARWLMK